MFDREVLLLAAFSTRNENYDLAQHDTFSSHSIHLLNKLYSEETLYIMTMPIILALYSVLRVHIMT